MKALTLYQPWAQMVALGFKRFETRSWATGMMNVRLAIHASGNSETLEQHASIGSIPRAWHGALGIIGINVADGLRLLPLGAVVATAQLVECIRTAYVYREELAAERFHPSDRQREYPIREEYLGDFGPGRYAWRLTHVLRLPEPIPMRGQRGFWTLTPEQESEVRAAESRA